MAEKERTIGYIVGPRLRHQLEALGRKVSLEKAKIFDLRERELIYRGIKGKIWSYYDGIQKDHLVFSGFPLGPEWEELKKSIHSFGQEASHGSYEVQAKINAQKAEIVLIYSDEDYPKSYSPRARFRKIWQDFNKVLPQEPDLVDLGRAQIIKEFILQDLLVED